MEWTTPVVPFWESLGFRLRKPIFYEGEQLLSLPKSWIIL